MRYLLLATALTASTAWAVEAEAADEDLISAEDAKSLVGKAVFMWSDSAKSFSERAHPGLGRRVLARSELLG
jgi:hypothetical protein